MAVEEAGFGGILSGSFDWNAGKLVHKDVKLIQSEYLKRGATQIGVAERFGTSKKTMGACLKRSGAAWIPDPVHEREKKVRYKQDRDIAWHVNASLQDDLDFLADQLRNAKTESEEALEQERRRYRELLDVGISETERLEGVQREMIRVVHEQKGDLATLRSQVTDLQDALADAHSGLREALHMRERGVLAEGEKESARRRRKRRDLEAEVSDLTTKLKATSKAAETASREANDELGRRDQVIEEMRAAAIRLNGENEALKAEYETFAGGSGPGSRESRPRSGCFGITVARLKLGFSIRKRTTSMQNRRPSLSRTARWSARLCRRTRPVTSVASNGAAREEQRLVQQAVSAAVGDIAAGPKCTELLRVRRAFWMRKREKLAGMYVALLPCVCAQQAMTNGRLPPETRSVQCEYMFAQPRYGA
jgi:hypothetical protein